MASDDELWDALEEEQGGEAGWRGISRGQKWVPYGIRNPLKWLMTNHFELRKLVKFLQKSTKLPFYGKEPLRASPTLANSEQPKVLPRWNIGRRIFGSLWVTGHGRGCFVAFPCGALEIWRWQAKAEGDIFFVSTFEQTVFF